jgi:CDP-glucose 4,6-dehydratase
MDVGFGALEDLEMNINQFWKGRRVLITGHTGFKGSWLTIWLAKAGARVTGLSLPPKTSANLFELARVNELVDSHYCDIRDPIKTASIIDQAQPEIVFHLAAQSLVRPSYEDPLQTFATNTMGTAHVLNALRTLSDIKVAIIVTTDKVYDNIETYFPYRESDPLGGHDPYSASKAASEILVASYRKAFLANQGIAIATARSGNVIGGGDWSEDRLIPDMVKAWQFNQPLLVRNPDATRPWQHVLEPLYGYIKLAQKLWEKPDAAGPYNFGPSSSSAETVKQVIEIARLLLKEVDVRYSNISSGPHESHWLALETAKTRNELGITPIWSLKESIDYTVNWYLYQNKKIDARTLCESNITDYEAIA